jgi:hypothetical protein
LIELECLATFLPVLDKDSVDPHEELLKAFIVSLDVVELYVALM